MKQPKVEGATTQCGGETNIAGSKSETNYATAWLSSTKQVLLNFLCQQELAGNHHSVIYNILASMPQEDQLRAGNNSITGNSCPASPVSNQLSILDWGFNQPSNFVIPAKYRRKDMAEVEPSCFGDEVTHKDDPLGVWLMGGKGGNTNTIWYEIEWAPKSSTNTQGNMPPEVLLDVSLVAFSQTKEGVASQRIIDTLKAPSSPDTKNNDKPSNRPRATSVSSSHSAATGTSACRVGKEGILKVQGTSNSGSAASLKWDASTGTYIGQIEIFIGITSKSAGGPLAVRFAVQEEDEDLSQLVSTKDSDRVATSKPLQVITRIRRATFYRPETLISDLKKISKNLSRTTNTIHETKAKRLLDLLGSMAASIRERSSLADKELPNEPRKPSTLSNKKKRKVIQTSKPVSQPWIGELATFATFPTAQCESNLVSSNKKQKVKFDVPVAANQQPATWDVPNLNLVHSSSIDDGQHSEASWDSSSTMDSPQQSQFYQAYSGASVHPTPYVGHHDKPGFNYTAIESNALEEYLRSGDLDIELPRLNWDSIPTEPRNDPVSN